jgi:hypothetical protein
LRDIARENTLGRTGTPSWRLSVFEQFAQFTLATADGEVLMPFKIILLSMMLVIGWPIQAQVELPRCMGGYRIPSYDQYMTYCTWKGFNRFVISGVVETVVGYPGCEGTEKGKKCSCMSSRQISEEEARFDFTDICNDAMAPQIAEERKRGVIPNTKEQVESRRADARKLAQDRAAERAACKRPIYGDEGDYAGCRNSEPRGKREGVGKPAGRPLYKPLPCPPGDSECQGELDRKVREKNKADRAAEDERKRVERERRERERGPGAPTTPAADGTFSVTYGLQGSAFVVQGSNQGTRMRNCNISYTLDYVEFGVAKTRSYSTPFVLYGNWSGVAVQNQTTYAASTLRVRDGVQWSCA